MNKITKTKVGDEIHYFVNGQENHGVVAKMSASYVTIFKEDGMFYEVPLNDTFFVKDILINKSWNDMSMEERTEILQKAKAYSPRYLAKTWEDLPTELKDVLKIKDGVLPKSESSNKPTLPYKDVQNRSSQAKLETGKDVPINEGYKVTDLEQTGQTGKAPKDLSKLKKALESLQQLTKDKGVAEPRPKSQSSGTPSPARLGVTGINPTGKRGQGIMELNTSKYTRDFVDSNREEKDVTQGMHAIGKKPKPVSQKPASSKPKKEISMSDLDSSGKLKKAIDSLNKLKSDVERGVYGAAAGSPLAGVSTNTSIDADKEYEGQSHDGIRSEQFKYEDKKPKVDEDPKTTNKAGEFVYSENTPYKTKSIGVPENHQNTWGIKYLTKEEAEKLSKKE